MGSAALHGALIHRPASGSGDDILLMADSTQAASGAVMFSLAGELPALDADCGDELVVQLAATGSANFIELSVSGSLP